MPTFTTVALDRLIEPRSSKYMAPGKSIPVPKLDRRNSTPVPNQGRGVNGPCPKPERSNSTVTADKKNHWSRISPALYATPASTPIPDSPTSPSSYPPSPYIVNHKRRGPRLFKSFSEEDVVIRPQDLGEEKATGFTKTEESEAENSGNSVDVAKNKETGVLNLSSGTEFSAPIPRDVEEKVDFVRDGELGIPKFSNGSSSKDMSVKSVTFNVEQDKDTEVDDFVDPHDSMSVTSNSEMEGGSGVDRSLNLGTPVAEFYDAWEELSSESGPQNTFYDIEAELREIRLTLLMEIEKRKQAEESLNNIRHQWLRICEHLSLAGLVLPADPTAALEYEQGDDIAEELCRQVHLARFVSDSIGRGAAKAEVEEEMEAQIELKNFEIARLLDRLHYYEAVNQEMSQRNQETVETARRQRQLRKRRQKWVWGSIAAAITLGSAALAWSYFPTAKVSDSANPSPVAQGDRSSE